MPQPFPDTACRHHTPGGLANSSIAGTLQHIMQVPQARPGTRCGRSEVANSAPFMRSATCGSTFNGRSILSMRQRQAVWGGRHGRGTVMKYIMHLATFTAVSG